MRAACSCLRVDSESRRMRISCCVEERICLASMMRFFSASSSAEILATMAFWELVQISQVTRMPMARAIAAIKKLSLVTARSVVNVDEGMVFKIISCDMVYQRHSESSQGDLQAR